MDKRDSEYLLLTTIQRRSNQKQMATVGSMSVFRLTVHIHQTDPTICRLTKALKVLFDGTEDWLGTDYVRTRTANYWRTQIQTFVDLKMLSSTVCLRQTVNFHPLLRPTHHSPIWPKRMILADMVGNSEHWSILYDTCA